LIHPTVWPQYTNVTDRQNRTGPMALDELFYKRSPKNETATVHVFKNELLELSTLISALSTNQEYFSTTVLALESWHKGSNVPSHQESLNEEKG